jgi:hypothetical protein
LLNTALKGDANPRRATARFLTRRTAGFSDPCWNRIMGLSKLAACLRLPTSTFFKDQTVDPATAFQKYFGTKPVVSRSRAL